MKRVVLIVMAVFFGVTNVVAQQPDSVKFETFNARIDSLQTKLDKLQADYDYLSCEYEITRLDNQLRLFINQIKLASHSLEIVYYHTRFDVDLYLVHKKEYESSVRLFNTFIESIASTKTSIFMKTVSSKFSEKENQNLKNLCDILDASVQLADETLKGYKIVVDMYKSR